jgi:hypothetical protein
VLTLAANDDSALSRAGLLFSITNVSGASLSLASWTGRQGRFLFSKLFLIALFQNTVNSTGFENNGSAVRVSPNLRASSTTRCPRRRAGGVRTQPVHPIGRVAQGQIR